MPTPADHRTEHQDLANQLMEQAYAKPEMEEWINRQHRWTLSHRGTRDNLRKIMLELASSED